MNQRYAYSRDNRKIKFRMVSAQHFINEAPGIFMKYRNFAYCTLYCRNRKNNLAAFLQLCLFPLIMQKSHITNVILVLFIHYRINLYFISFFICSIYLFFYFFTFSIVLCVVVIFISLLDFYLALIYFYFGFLFSLIIFEVFHLIFFISFQLCFNIFISTTEKVFFFFFFFTLYLFKNNNTAHNWLKSGSNKGKLFML